MKKCSLLIISALIALTSCEDLLSGEDGELSSNDVVLGLKTALKIGTDSSTTMLSMKDGYYGDALMRILLPQEAQYLEGIINQVGNVQYFSSVSDEISEKLDDLVLAINRSAEDAAADAKPIFSDAITGLSIKDGLAILNGQVPESQTKSGTEFDSLAAMHYLKQQTYDSLVNAYAPRINTALDKKLVGNASATSLWNDITGRWNGLMQNEKAIAAVSIYELSTGKSLNLHEVNTDLGEYTTEQALERLFTKVGDQEKAIRKNPFQWASDIIKKVFGSVYEALGGNTDE